MSRHPLLVLLQLVPLEFEAGQQSVWGTGGFELGETDSRMQRSCRVT